MLILRVFGSVISTAEVFLAQNENQTWSSFLSKRESNVISVHAMRRVEVQLQSFLSLPIHGGNWSTSCPSCCTLRQRIPVSIELEGGWAVELFWMFCRREKAVAPARGELSYLAPLGSANISAPYFKQCFFRGGDYPPD